MKKYLFLIMPTVMCIYFLSCTHPTRVLVAPTNSVTRDTNTTTTDTMQEIVDTSVCFERDVLPIFTGSCAKSGCHDATSRRDGYYLATYAGIVSKGIKPGNASGSKVYTECTSGKMPEYPTPRLDSTQLSFIRRWINMGAHNDTNCAVNCDTTKFTFAAAIVPILSKYCYSCHASAPAAGSGGGIVLDNYNGVAAQAQSGALLADIMHQPGHNYMPLGGQQLSDCKITQISKWINAGMPNN